MAIIATAGETFVPAPSGLHPAVCVDVVDMGKLKVTFGQETKTKHIIRLVWQIDEPMENGKRFIVQRRYTLSLHEKSTLRKDLESWRGRPFNPDESQGFDVERLIGVNCQINVQHNTKNGSTYANVVSVVPLGRGMAKMEPQEYVRAKDRTDKPESELNEVTVDDIPF